jgi:uncharacterized DUF497 family protein
MTKFIIQPHGRLNDWVADEKGYFTEEGLDYELNVEGKGGPEMRYAALGKTYGSRLLAVVFTIRSKRIRVISARPMSRKERKLYEEEN